MLKGLENIPVKIDNETGEEIFTLDCTIDASRRPSEKQNDHEDESEEGEVPVDQTDPPDSKVENEGESVDDGMVHDDWRLISAVKTWPNTGFFRPQLVDYSHNYGKVLRQAIPLINENHPDLMWDHSGSSRDIAGYVENARWENSRDIPPGVNASLVVDPTFDQRAAIGLANKTLRSGSIGFTMELRKSHPKMEFSDFVERQGEVIDDEEVRWIPKIIKAVRHMALVPAGAGADPHAGRRVSATKSTIQNKKVEEHDMAEYVALLCQICEKMGLDVILDEKHPIPEALPEKIFAALDRYEGAYEKHNDLVMKLASISEEHLKNEDGKAPTVAELVGMLPGKLSMAAQADVIIRHQKSEALRLFDLAKLVEGKSDFTPAERRIRARIEESSDLEFLNDMIAEYAPIAEEKFGRRSSLQEELPEDKIKDPDLSGHEKDIRESVRRIFPKKENK